MFIKLKHPVLVPAQEVWPIQWPQCPPVRLNNDAGSAPHGPRQMAGSSLWSPPWPRSPPLLSVHLHPNTPIIFIPATPSTRHCAKNPSPNPPSHVNRGENEPFRFCWCVSHHAEDYIPSAKNTWCTMMEMEENTLLKDNFIHFLRVYQLIHLFLRLLLKSYSVCIN